MYSAAGFWNNGEIRRNKRWPSRGLRFLDSGGFLLLNLYGEYPFSVINFANLVARLRPHYYATMDYPCEPNISRKLGLLTNEERITKTVSNAGKLLAIADELPGQCVPVIQGYKLEEYQYCLDLHYQTGTIRDYMAVGSMCRRISNQELLVLIPGVYQHAYQYGVRQLHFFGLKLSPKLTPYSDYIYSRDSAAVLDVYDPIRRKSKSDPRFPKTKEEKKQAFFRFFDKLDKLGLEYKS